MTKRTPHRQPGPPSLPPLPNDAPAVPSGKQAHYPSPTGPIEQSIALASARSRGLFLCKECSRQLPRSAFGDRKDNVCMECGNAQYVQREKMQMQDHALEMMELLNIKQQGDAIVVSAGDLCKRIIASFGSLELFVLNWKQRLDRHIEEKGVTGVVLNHYAMIFRLIAETSKQEHQQEVDKMTLDQIRDEQRSMLVKMLMEHSRGAIKDEAISKMLQGLGLVDTGPVVEAEFSEPQRLSQAEVDDL